MHKLDNKGIQDERPKWCKVHDLLQAYVHELGQCLLQVDDDPTGKMDERLLVLSVEGMRLVGRRLLHNPAAHKALITVDLAEGQPTLLQLDSTFYTNLLVSTLTLIDYSTFGSID